MDVSDANNTRLSEMHNTTVKSEEEEPQSDEDINLVRQIKFNI